MITITEQDREKLVMLDKIFTGITQDDIKILAEREDIVARLKGEGNQIGLICQMINELQIQQMDIQNLRGEIMALRSDITAIVKTMAQPFPTNNNQNWEFQNLKNRCGIYT